MKIFLIDNKFFTEKNAKIPITDELLRGYGVFETLKTYEKKPYQTKEHIKRLFLSAKKINLKINHTEEQIISMIRKVANKSSHKSQRIKVVALKNQLIIISEEQKIDKKIYKNGVHLKSMLGKRELPEIKSISYLLPFLSHENAVRQNAFDALLIDGKKQIYEGAYSNIFWVKNGKLHTRKNGVLPGITAKTVIRISPFKINYKNISLDELKKSEEVFLTSSIFVVVPVIQIDNSKIGNGKPGTMTKQLISAYGSAEKSLQSE
ncbi:aminotransferase class IV family protein [Candidatus Peregrinibacteria bacterium]|nr:aminotransferase class IV family protein [Candidatus Peregrinibacteria bacterium]